MSDRLAGKTVAILATDGLEQSELIQPRDALSSAGAAVHVVSLKPGSIQGFKHFDRGESVSVDRTLDQVSARDYDAVVIPGGLFNPDALRVEEAALEFVRGFQPAGKVIGAICHGPWVLIDAGVVDGRSLTSVKNIRHDLINAGAHWMDEAVVIDSGFVTSRTPADLEAFCSALIEEIAQGRHAGHDG